MMSWGGLRCLFTCQTASRQLLPAHRSLVTLLRVMTTHHRRQDSDSNSKDVTHLFTRSSSRTCISALEISQRGTSSCFTRAVFLRLCPYRCERSPFQSSCERLDKRPRLAPREFDCPLISGEFRRTSSLFTRLQEHSSVEAIMTTQKHRALVRFAITLAIPRVHGVDRGNRVGM